MIIKSSLEMALALYRGRVLMKEIRGLMKVQIEYKRNQDKKAEE